MMDGRVKTLHPALHGGILARRDRPDDLAALARHGIGLVDLVVVNLYPFVKAAANPGDAVRRAGRGNRHRRPVARARGGQEFPRRAGRRRSRRLPAAARRRSTDGPTPRVPLRADAQGASRTRPRTTRRSPPRSRRRRSTGDRFDAAPTHAGAAPGRRLDLSLEKIRDLRYGENPHQTCRVVSARRCRRCAASGLGDATILQGKELSYTNLLDLDAAARIVLEFDEPAAVVIKHTNPCGAAIGIGRRCVRAGARRRQPRGLRRDRRAQSAARRRRGRGDRVDVHRGGDRAGGR